MFLAENCIYHRFLCCYPDFSRWWYWKPSVCGTLNDLLVMGATPKYLTARFILEEGMDMKDLEEIVKSMAL